MKSGLRGVLGGLPLGLVLASACGANDGKPALSDQGAVGAEAGASTRVGKASMTPLPRAQWGRDKCASRQPEGTGVCQRVRGMVLNTCEGTEVSLDD